MSDAAHYQVREDRDIAIVGMAGRFPGARNLEQFWDNLQHGREAVSFFSDDDLRAAGVVDTLLQDPHYIRAGTLLDDVDRFDAAFFGYTPREAELMDPQQRMFLECCWEALEHAGYDPAQFDGAIGVYAGVAWNTYLLSNLTTHPELFESEQAFQTFITNDKDFMATRVSYKLNLKGPSVIVQTSCSTSLVAVHLACLSLQDYDCDIGLVGGVTIKVPQLAGYTYQPGGLPSPDGHCRAFDAEAAGTIFGSGAGVVALKRLQDALDDGDTIYAVVRGTAINNDGSIKVSYTAPSVEGQGEVITAALAVAEVEAETIGYIEAHGTGTALGDPIEVAALTKAFRNTTQKTGFCGIGSVKTNLGHLDAAAGVAGLLKTVLALRHQQIPPSLHFERPNPKIDFASSPFYVNASLRPWPQLGAPRRAGVSSFGVGGTNAHVIVEEAPAQPPSASAPPWQLLPLSAKTPGALAMQATNLRAYLAQHPDANLADVAFTLQRGRQAFAHRRVLVVHDHADALALLDGAEPERVLEGVVAGGRPNVAFLFPGQGAQHVGMGHALYEHAPVFRATVDQCCALLQPLLGLDLRTLLYPAPEGHDDAAAQLRTTAIAQPALFVIEYALAQLWLSAGVQPSALLGHSLGELVAATLAAVFTLPDALRLVAARGRLMQACPPGALLAVPLAEAALAPLLDSTLSLAAVNGPRQCVVAGPEAAIAVLAEQLQAQDISARRLPSAHAFHSALLDPAVAAFAQEVARVPRAAPQIPFLSNLSGTWITAAEASDPHYWAQQLRQPVRFAAGLSTLLATPDTLLLEVGPGTTLSTLARQQERPQPPLTLASLRHAQDQRAERAVLLSAAGQLWLQGVALDWAALHAAPRRRVPLPTYPFERQRFWIDAQPRGQSRPLPTAQVAKRPDISDWFYLPSWRRSLSPAPQRADQRAATDSWLLFADDQGIAAGLAERLGRDDQPVVLVRPGSAFAEHSEDSYSVDPRRPEDYRALLAALAARNRLPTAIGHLWTLTAPEASEEDFDAVQTRGFFSLLFLTQALVEQSAGGAVRIDVVSSQMQSIAGEPALHPAKATLLGACNVISQEYPQIICRSIDVLVGAESAHSALIRQLLAELSGPSDDPVMAYRGGQRWVQSFEPVRLEPVDADAGTIRPGGVYLVTGGLSGAGFELATQLASIAPIRLVIIEPIALPPRTLWPTLPEDAQADEVRQMIRRVQALEAAGAQVTVHQADLEDRGRLAAIIHETLTQFDALHGVIHAPGIASAQMFRAVQELDRAACEWHLGPKARGLLALDAALGDIELDFGLIVSSLTSILGGRGYTAYAAANLFMDAFARQQAARQPGRWRAVNWDAWEFSDEQEQITALSSDLAQLAMQPPEGAEVFRRILGAPVAEQIVVSTADLTTRIAHWRSSITARRTQLEDSSSAGPVQLHTRPQLASAYVAPVTELERSLAQIWQRALGFEQVGIHDNFFELGGDSFIAIQVVSQVKKELEIDLPAVKLYQGLTIKVLAELLQEDQEQAAQRRNAQLEDRKQQMSQRRQYQQMRRTRQ